MARSYSHPETWVIPEGTDTLGVIAALDAYLSERVGTNAYTLASIFDERGSVRGSTWADALVEWNADPHPIRTVIVPYAASPDGLSAQLLAASVSDVNTPTVVELTVTGSDPAEVRGVALEARDRGERGVVTPPAPAARPVVEPETLPVVTHAPVIEAPVAETPPVVVEAPTVPPPVQPSRLVSFFNHPWVVGIGVTVVGGGILWVLLAWFN